MNKFEITVGTYLLILALNSGGNLTIDNSYYAPLDIPVGIEYYMDYQGNSTVLTGVYSRQFDMLTEFANSIFEDSFDLDPDIMEMVDDLFFELL